MHSRREGTSRLPITMQYLREHAVNSFKFKSKMGEQKQDYDKKSKGNVFAKMSHNSSRASARAPPAEFMKQFRNPTIWTNNCQQFPTRVIGTCSSPEMTLPPIFYHVFRPPLPYSHALRLQETIHQVQTSFRRSNAHKDVLLLLEHRPVYTSGRRQTASSITDESQRLTRIGADFVISSRGGQLTYHGPGQIVGYPMMDLSRYTPVMGARDYVCRMQKMVEQHLLESHGLQHTPSEHTGVFLDPMTKIASIGVQIRHRLTSHGFAFNATREPLAWFDQVVACGLNDVKAGSVESATNNTVDLRDEFSRVVEAFGRAYDREMVILEPETDGEIGEAILAVEAEALLAGSWAKKPRL